MAPRVQPREEPRDEHGDIVVQRPMYPAPGRTAWAVYVFEAPVRLWHAVVAVCMFVLFITGYLIGSPPASVAGEASNSFLFGYIRMAHFIAGQLIAVFTIMRVYWAFVGNEHAREVFTPPFHKASFWKGVWHQQLYYLFVRKDSAKHLGHNPLETTAMVFTFMIPLFFMILSGFALYAEGLGMNHWLYSAFGWVLVVFGGSFVVHTLHHIGMWIMAVFTCIHLYMVFREDIMGRTGILSSIVSGWRYMKDDKP